MGYTVFFKERNQIITADKFISEQPMEHQPSLTAIAEELSDKGATTSPLARKNSTGEWTIVLNNNGDVYIYTMYVSKFEMPPGQVKQEARADDVKKTLVIIDPMGARDSIGGYHPGYWTVDQYADFLQENQRALFTQTIVEVKRNVPSENYSIQRDGSISIHIDKKVNTSIVTLSCRAKWI